MKFRIALFLIVLSMVAPAVVLAVAPAAPGTPYDTNVTENTIALEWDASALATKYTVKYSTQNDLSTNYLVQTATTNNTTLTNLDANTTYYIAVTAENDIGEESQPSGTATIITLQSSDTPAPPTGLSLAGIDTIAQNGFGLVWDEYTGTDFGSYRIFYGTTPGSYSGNKDVSTQSDPQTTLAPLTQSTRYYVSMKIINTKGQESEYATELIVDTLPDSLAPNVPYSVQALKIGASITVYFNGNNDRMADLAGYRIHYTTEGVAGINSVDVGPVTEYTFTGLSFDQNHTFWVTAYDYSNNESNPSATTLAESTTTFLGDGTNFEGGCFVDTARPANGKGTGLMLAVLLLLPILILIGPGRRRWTWLVLMPLVLMPLSLHAQEETPANTLCIKMGAFVASDSAQTDGYYKDNPLFVGVSYDRAFSDHFSGDVEVGYINRSGTALTGSGATTVINTRLHLIPISTSLKFRMNVTRLVSFYLGGGLDYWFYRESSILGATDAIEEGDYGVAGYHGKGGLVFTSADPLFHENAGLVFEGKYAVVDRFGDNDLDLGGWILNAGVFYRF